MVGFRLCEGIGTLQIPATPLPLPKFGRRQFSRQVFPPCENSIGLSEIKEVFTSPLFFFPIRVPFLTYVALW